MYLEERKTYLFTYTGNLTLSDNEIYFIFSDFKGNKHLIPEKYYKHYNLKIGNNINCRIDKINCQGRVYIEPQNPFYKVGEIYEFDFVERKISKDKKSKICYQLFFKGIGENKAVYTLYDLNIFQSFNLNRITAKVIRIKKALIYIDLF